MGVTGFFHPRENQGDVSTPLTPSPSGWSVYGGGHSSSGRRDGLSLGGEGGPEGRPDYRRTRTGKWSRPGRTRDDGSISPSTKVRPAGSPRCPCLDLPTEDPGKDPTRRIVRERQGPLHHTPSGPSLTLRVSSVSGRFLHTVVDTRLSSVLDVTVEAGQIHSRL